MILLKKSVGIVALFVSLAITSAQGQDISFKKSTSFYPEAERLKQEEIIWGYLSVPENWARTQRNKIDLAVALLKNTSGKLNADAVVYLPGGPGGSGISSIGFWLDHPLRKEYDILLFDVRGTGFSKPRLCPDLGKEFLRILAKNQSSAEDEKQKTAMAMACKNTLIEEGIDVHAYHSQSVAKDLHALKQYLGYSKWHVYGASYGTYMAQVYASEYPEDTKSLILDSSIFDIAEYYTLNTSGYMNSLSKVFQQCKNDIECNSKFPNLETVYYQTIADLDKNPITVDVDLSVLPSGTFTYNSEDFKIAVQQALYDKKLIELVPLLIYQFYNKNKGPLGPLVSAFSSSLEMDYGVYYCVSCNEILPYNVVTKYEKDESQYSHLKGGISFYKSDFNVCDAWNAIKIENANIRSNLSETHIPILIYAGGFDPITPAVNGEKLKNAVKRGHLINAPIYGHGPSFSPPGQQIALNFINDPNKNQYISEFQQEQKVNFISNVKLNSGVLRLAESLNELNAIFLGPLFIAVGIIIVFLFIYPINLLRKKYALLSDKIIRVLVIITSIIGIGSLVGLIYALINVAGENYYILAFGLPGSYSYLFTGIIVFCTLLILTIFYLIFKFKKIQQRSVLFSTVFSNILLAVYMFYWQIF